MIYKGYAGCKTKKKSQNIFFKKETFIYQKYFFLIMDKRAQLGIIEFKFFFYGLLFGIAVALVLVLLGAKGVLPFQIPLVCG